MTDKDSTQLHVPYIGTSATGSADDVIALLEEHGVRRTIDSLTWRDKYPYHPLTTFSLAHTDDTLWIDFFVRSNYLRAVNDRINSPVYEDSCVGVFLQPAPDTSPDYMAFMINCIGTISGKIFRDGEKEQFISPEKLREISIYASCGSRPFRELEGLFTWNILIGIPLSLLGLHNPAFPVTVRGNFYKCASGTSQPHFLSWMPVYTPEPDFHRPESFGRLILE